MPAPEPSTPEPRVAAIRGSRPPAGDPVDLSQSLRTALPIVPGDPGVRIEPFATHETDGYAVTELHLGSHSGTHMDAPRHFFPEGRALDSYPLTRFIGRATVLDLRGLAPDTPISPEVLTGAIARATRGAVGAGTVDGEPSGSGADRAGGAPRGAASFALLWLGWDVHFGDSLMWRHPYLSHEAARLLVDRGVSLVGTDAASVDRSAVMETFPAHETLLGNDVLIVENLRGLDRLAAGHATCAFLPIPIAEADGAPVRAIAWPEEAPR